MKRLCPRHIWWNISKGWSVGGAYPSWVSDVGHQYVFLNIAENIIIHPKCYKTVGRIPTNLFVG